MGGSSVGNVTRISGRHKALKVKAQERFRDEISSVVVTGGLRAGSPRASKRCGRALERCGSLSTREPFAMHALKSPKVHGGCCFRRSVPCSASISVVRRSNPTRAAVVERTKPWRGGNLRKGAALWGSPPIVRKVCIEDREAALVLGTKQQAGRV